MEKQNYSNIQEELLQNYSKLSKKRIKRVEKEEQLESTIRSYLNAVREQLTVISNKYDNNFLMNVINSLVEDDTKITVGKEEYEVKDILTKYMSKRELIYNYLIPYIYQMRHLAQRIDILYKEEYEIDGLEGIEEITKLLPEIVEQEQIADNIPKEEIYYQVQLLKRMIAFKHDIYKNSDEIDTYENYNEGIEQSILKEKELAKKEWKYFVPRIK